MTLSVYNLVPKCLGAEVSWAEVSWGPKCPESIFRPNTFLSYFSSSRWHSKIRYGATGSIMMNGTTLGKLSIKVVNLNINVAV